MKPKLPNRLVDAGTGTMPARIPDFSREGFHSLVDVSADPVVAINEQGVISYWSPGSEQLFGYSAEEIIGKPITKLMPEEYRPRFHAAIAGLRATVGESPIMADNRALPALRKDGTKIYVELSRSVTSRNEKTFFTGVLRDVSKRYQWEETLTRRIAHERTVADIASRLVSTIDSGQALAESLADIGRQCDARRVCLFQFDEEAETMSCTRAWYAGGGPSQMHEWQDMPLLAYPWLVKKVEKQKTINIREVSNLPTAAAAERADLEDRGTSSMLVQPLIVDSQAIGFVAVDTEKNGHEWAPDTINLLKTSSSLISNALDRAATEKRLRESELKARRLFESAPISLWQVDYSNIMKLLVELADRGVSDWRKYFDAHPEAVNKCLDLIIITDINKATLDLFEADSKEDFISGFESVLSAESAAGFKEQLITLALGRSRHEGENYARTLNGRRLRINTKIFARPGHDKSMSEVYCAITNVTERRRAKLSADRRLEYEKVISSLAARFVAPRDLNAAIKTTLSELGRFCHADRSFMILFDGAQPGLTHMHNWESDGIKPLKRNDFLHIQDFPWIIAKLRNGEAIRLRDVCELADDALIDQRNYLELKLLSLLVMPLYQQNTVIGCVGLNSSSQARDWSEENASVLLVGSSIITNALQRQAADTALVSSERKYRSLIESASDAIFITDMKTGLIMDVNREAERLLGRPAMEIIGLHRSELHPPADAEQYRQDFASWPESDKDRNSDVFVVTLDGDHIPVEISSGIIDIGDQQIIQSIFRNVTDKHNARKLRDALNKILSVINSTLHFDHAIERTIADASKALDCDSAIALALNDDRWIAEHVHGFSDDLVGTTFSKEELSHVTLSARKRRPLAFNDTLHDAQIDQHVAERLGIKSMLVVPIIIREEITKCLTFCHRTEPVSFDEMQIDFVNQLGRATSFALENARLYAEKRHIADALQQSLLTMPKTIPGVNFGNLYRSATKTTRVGGDFYDIFELHDDRVGLVIGDVSGKGLEAAKLTSLVKNTIRAYAAEDYSPAEVMAKTNELTLQFSRPSTFVTVFFAVLDKTAHELSYCSAGHPPALLKTDIGRAQFLAPNSPAIGIMADLTFRTNRHAQHHGDVLFLYTDGATDARCGNEMFGDDRLKKLVANIKHETTEELPHLVFAELLDFTNSELADDLAILTVSLT